MSYSFFYAAGTAGYVRGEQIANYLGGKKNPTKDYENDICVYVKVIPPENKPVKTFVDVDDSTRAVDYLKNHREVGIIVNSKNSFDYLSRLLGRDDIYIIPHAHCNYERWLRPTREVETVGIIGCKTSFQYPVALIRQELKKIGLILLYEEDYWQTYRSTEEKEGRLRVVDFYKSVDIQIVWRPKMYAGGLKNPNKLVNASSFGIPTVAYPEKGFDELGEYYIKTDTMDNLLNECKKLKDNQQYYKSWSSVVYKKAEDYHIEKISKLYKKL